MRVLLKTILDAPPEAVWRAVRSPASLQEVSSPVIEMESAEPGGFPTLWEAGDHRVRMRGLGLVPIGEQIISLSFSSAPGIRVMRDRGRGVSGVLAAATLWDHRLAVAPDPAGTGKTLYRDQLRIAAGVLTPAAWYSLFWFWQWRQHRMRTLAPTWTFEPEPTCTDDPPASTSITVD